MSTPPPLLDLPPELQTAIASYIPRPRDLKNLCLSCKQLRSIALPILYHTVVLDSKAYKNGSSFLELDHPGHPFVRCVIIRDEADYEKTEGGNFSCTTPSHRALSRETLLSLYSNQKKIEKLSLGPCPYSVPLTRGACAQRFSRITDLDYSPFVTKKDDFDIYGDIISTAARMKRLVIRECWLTDKWVEDAVLKSFGGDAKKEAEFTVNKLFCDTLRIKIRHDRLKLNELRLVDLELDGIAELLSSKIDFLQLRSLSLSYGNGCDRFLEFFTKVFKQNRPALEAFYLEDSEDSEVRASGADISSFLESFTGLRYLHLKARGPRQGLDLSFLKKHSATLRHLGLKVRTTRAFDGNDHWALSVDDIRTVTPTCRDLRELQISFPEMSVDELSSDDTDYGMILACIKTLPHIEILHINDWPIAREIDQDPDERDVHIYHRDLDIFATQVVQKLSLVSDKPKLQILCIGDPYVNEDVVYSEDGHLLPGLFPRAFYLTAVQTDRYGNIRPVAVRTDASVMRFEEPGFDSISRSNGEDGGMSGGGYLHSLD